MQRFPNLVYLAVAVLPLVGGACAAPASGDLCAEVTCEAGTVCGSDDGLCHCAGPVAEVCGTGFTCDGVSGACEAVGVDLCADVTCEAGEVCAPDSGDCLCGEVACVDGTSCDPDTTTCVSDDPCQDVSCGEGEACDADTGTCQSTDPCAGVVCEGDATCDGLTGACACAEGVVCGEGEACYAGGCFPTACADEVVANPALLDFGTLGQMDEAVLDVVLTNEGGTACPVRGVSLDWESDVAFGLPVEEQLGPRVLPAGEPYKVSVRFRPPEPSGAVTGTLVVAGAASEVRVGLAGTSATPEWFLSSRSLDFGPTTSACEEVVREVCLWNPYTRGSTLELAGLAIEAPGATGSFTVTDAPVLPAQVLGGEKLCLSVAYSAADPGLDYGALYLTFAGGGLEGERFLVPLRGEGRQSDVRTDTFLAGAQRKVDVLFVVDDSGSMGWEQERLGANFDSFIEEAAGVDYRIAAASSDCDDDGTCGLLQRSSDQDTPLVVTPATDHPAATFATLVTTGDRGSATERGFKAAFRALTVPRAYDPAFNGGFLRPEADLAIVFVSDESEQSLYETFYLWEAAFRSLKGADRPDRLNVSAVAGPPPDGCSGTFGNAVGGPRYAEMVALTGGAFEPICTEDWAGAMGRIGQSVFGQPRYRLSGVPTRGTLSVTLVDPEGQLIVVPGEMVSVNPRLNSLDFDPLYGPSKGDRIQVSYVARCNP